MDVRGTVSVVDSTEDSGKAPDPGEMGARCKCSYRCSGSVVSLSNRSTGAEAGAEDVGAGSEGSAESNRGAEDES